MDEKNKALLAALRKNSRKTVQELAEELEIPRSTVHDRIQRLDAEGYIKKWTVVPDYKKIGKPTTVFILAKYVRGEGVSQRKIIEQIAKIPEIFEVHMVTGTWDILIKARIGSMDELSVLTIDKLGEMKGIGERVTMGSLACSKEEI